MSTSTVDLDHLDDLGRRAGLDESHLTMLQRGVERDDDSLRRDAVRSLDRQLPIDKDTALRLIGKDHEVRSDETWACVHTDPAAADLFAYLNEHCHGHEILDRVPVDGGELVVLDLRPAIQRLRGKYSA